MAAIYANDTASIKIAGRRTVNATAVHAGEPAAKPTQSAPGTGGVIDLWRTMMGYRRNSQRDCASRWMPGR